MRLITTLLGLLGLSACVDITGAADWRAAAVTWMETTWQADSAFHLRVLGTAGCGGLEEIGIDVLESGRTTDLLFRTRVRQVDVPCLFPQPFDTTLVINSNRLREFVHVLTPLGSAEGLRYLEVDRSRRGPDRGSAVPVAVTLV